MKYLILLFVLFTFSTNINQKSVVASYDIGGDFIMIERTIFNQYLSDTNLISYYYNIYQDKTNKQLYIASLKLTNNIFYTMDSNLINEPLFDSYQAECLEYLGSLSKLERIYKKKKSTQLYIKTLTPFQDKYYIIETYQNKKTIYTTNKLVNQIYPYMSYEDGSFGEIYYTNNLKMHFGREWLRYTNKNSMLYYYYTE